MSLPPFTGGVTNPSTGVELSGTSIASTARYNDGLADKILLNFGNYSTNASFAVYTYVQTDDFNKIIPAVYEMELNRSSIAVYAEEGKVFSLHA